jgi:uncharacterized Zn finger protein (UPF0148 family)
MDSEKYTRSVALLCPTCGNSLLEQSEDSEKQERTIYCPSCDRTMTTEELIHENGEVIDGAVDQMREEVLEDVQKELKDMLKNAFKGSKHIRIS